LEKEINRYKEEVEGSTPSTPIPLKAENCDFKYQNKQK